MDFVDTAIDRIHYLVDRSYELMGNGMNEEAALLMQQAVEIAAEIRDDARTLVTVA